MPNTQGRAHVEYGPHRRGERHRQGTRGQGHPLQPSPQGRPLHCCGLFQPAVEPESELFAHVKRAYTSADHGHRGLFELAGGGTLFLDAVTSITPKTQAKLLRMLESREGRPVGSEKEKQADIRVIAAGNCDLRELAG